LLVEKRNYFFLIFPIEREEREKLSDLEIEYERETDDLIENLGTYLEEFLDEYFLERYLERYLERLIVERLGIMFLE